MVKRQMGFVCDYCKRNFTRKYNLQHHIENYHLKSTYSCEICEQGFGTQSSLQLHLSRGHNRHRQPFPECDLCGRIFTRKQNVTSHMITVHLRSAKPKIRCKICDKTFTTERNLRRHTVHVHRPDAACLTCDKCKKIFKGKHLLIAHILSTHQQMEIKCKFCDKVYLNKRSLKRHLEMHSGKAQYRCDSCPKVYTSNHSLRRHVRTGHKLTATTLGTDGIDSQIGNGLKMENQGSIESAPAVKLKSEFSCNKCDKHFSHEPLLRQHIKQDHNFQDFYDYCRRSLLKIMNSSQKRRSCVSCEFCRDSFSSTCELKDHMRVNHDRDYNLSQCNVCYNKFYSKEALTEHRKVCVPPPDVNHCPYCSKLFTDISSLHFHIRIFHSQPQIGGSLLSCGNIEDPSTVLGCYKCEHCNRVYYSDRSLKHHMKLKHSAEQMVECQFCGKVCDNKYYLASHIKIVHTATTWMKCDYCDKQFKSKRNIRRHIEYTHLGTQRYRCIECETLFKEKRSLRKHVRIKHPDSNLFPGCHICHKRFESAKSCKIHLKLIHSFNMNTHPCDLCSDSFDSMEALNIHLQTNHLAKDEIYKCEDCNLLFQGHAQFDRHNETMHLPLVLNKRHQTLPRCVVCIKDFSSRKTLKRHIRKFHEEFDVEELANYGWLVRATSVECAECIKTFNDDVKHSFFQELKHARESIIFTCSTCLTSYNALEYAVLRYKLVDAGRGKMMLSEFCTAVMSDGELDGVKGMDQETTIKIEVSDLLYDIKSEPLSP